MLTIHTITKKVKLVADQYDLIFKVYLFGSYAKGVATEDSDVDLLIETDPSISLEVLAFLDDVENELKVHLMF